MNRFENLFKPLNTLLMALLVAAFVAGCGDGGSGTSTFTLRGESGAGPGPAGASPNLGTASTYGVFASNGAITLAANSLVNGDVGLNPLGACGNCVVGVTVNGAINNPAIQAQSDINAAYLDAANRSTNACTLVGPADISAAQAACAGLTPGTPGPVYGPGLYRAASPIGFTGTITLDAGGNPNAVFIFQTNAALTTGSNSIVVLANGARAKNVWWMVGSAATLGTSSTFKGTVIANGAAITSNGGTVTQPTLVEGRLLSDGAAVTVGTYTTVTVPK